MHASNTRHRIPFPTRINLPTSPHCPILSPWSLPHHCNCTIAVHGGLLIYRDRVAAGNTCRVVVVARPAASAANHHATSKVVSPLPGPCVVVSNDVRILTAAFGACFPVLCLLITGEIARGLYTGSPGSHTMVFCPFRSWEVWQKMLT